MILVFTSTAFTAWVKDHVNSTSDATFNPYLTFLFYALYVFISSFSTENALTECRFTGLVSPPSALLARPSICFCGSSGSDGPHTLIFRRLGVPISPPLLPFLIRAELSS